MAANIPVNRTKIRVPERRNGLLSRSRLLGLLYELLDKKLVLITAPAGYGKTSLLIDLAHQSDLPTCWLALDTLDQDAQRFITYFIASIAECFPEFGNQSFSALKSLTSLDRDLESLITILVNEIYEQIHEHFILVLDDYHFIERIPEIQNFVNRFIQLVDESCHLIISSRTLIALPDLPLIIARGQAGGLDFMELAFTVDEVRTLFDQIYQVHITDTVAQELIQETEGWITGLQLSNLVMAKVMPDRLRLARASGVGLFDYLSQQVLDQQPKELQEFLLLSSLLDEFNDELCEEVLTPFATTRKNWAELIKSVQRNNLFISPLSEDGRWLRYHHLFQEFLQAQCKQVYPDLVNPILHHLAETHEHRGEWEKAYQIYQCLDDVNSLAILIEQSSKTLLINGRILTLRAWLDNLPVSIIQVHPGLLSLQGCIDYMTGDLTHGLLLLTQAENTFRIQKDMMGLALALVRRSLAHRYKGDYLASIKDADEVLNLTEGNEELLDIHAEAKRAKGLSLYRLGQVRDAISWLEGSLEEYTLHGEEQAIPMLLLETGMAYRASADYHAAENSYDKALVILKKEGNLNWQANLLNNLGGLYHAQGKYENALLAFEQGLQCAQHSGNLRMEALILCSLGDMYAELEEMDTAQKTYWQAQGIAQQINDRFLVFSVTFSQACLSRLRKEYDQAHRQLENLQTITEAGKSLYERGLYHLEQGRLLLTEGHATQSVPNFMESGKLLEKGGQIVEYAQSQLWLASAYLQSDDNNPAIKILQSVLPLIGQVRISHSLITAIWQTRTWLDKQPEDCEPCTELVDLINRADQSRAELPATRKRIRRLTSAVTMPMPRLIIKALGPARVKVDDTTITTSKWQTQSVRDLFFYFVSASQPMSKEQIGLYFWPDLEPLKLKIRFKNDIYRLRRAVGQDAILFSNEQYYFNRNLDYDYDAETFKDHLTLARSSSDSKEQINHYQAAVNLVQGPYLADIDMIWVLSERERLGQEYLSATAILAELYLNYQQYNEALQSCQRALDYDVYFEEAHRLLMRIYDRIGNRSAITRQYQACKDALKELDVPTSKETEELYQRLIAK